VAEQHTFATARRARGEAQVGGVEGPERPVVLAVHRRGFRAAAPLEAALLGPHQVVEPGARQELVEDGAAVIVGDGREAAAGGEDPERELDEASALGRQQSAAVARPDPLRPQALGVGVEAPHELRVVHDPRAILAAVDDDGGVGRALGRLPANQIDDVQRASPASARRRM
jgi:hypothetical protein